MGMDNKSPDAFRTISEVAEWLDVPTHVLRFWESRFTQVKPVKRAGGRRYYRPADMELLGGIKRLLHDDGLTIRGVQKLLREEGIAHVAALAPGGDAPAPDADHGETPMAVDVPPLPPRGEVVPFLPDTDAAPQFDLSKAKEEESLNRWPFVDEPESSETPESTPPEPPAEPAVKAQAVDTPPPARESSAPITTSGAMIAKLRAAPATHLKARADNLRPIVQRLSALERRMAPASED
ncbi:MerR family transcriptional regulator [Oceaniglobus trochenteri]|uniref:MerR family transcriptional regulator n=1 Tax=Oceaniglobus trochenteri TaxID=2763260 RepID=UPI001CFFBAD4|nr:MerR family transcriptional regulator [Oceaniglobus trochenteri]